MKKFLILFSVFSFSLTVAACVPSRVDEDKKLMQACQESVKAVADAADQFDFKKSSFKSGKGQAGVDLRIVSLTAVVIHDHGAEMEETPTCSYKEEWGLMNYRAEFYNLERNGAQYGNFDGHALGDPAALVKITEANDKVLSAEESPFF